MEIDVSDYVNGHTDGKKDSSTLLPVQPCASGEGLPYAPVDFPNPGDVWTWKVGGKVSASGHFTHRSLIVPKRLQKSPSRKEWLSSKAAITRYLQSEFPELDIGNFFASFTWDIPVGISATAKKAKESPSPATAMAKKRPSPSTNKAKKRAKKIPSPSSNTPKKRPSRSTNLAIIKPSPSTHTPMTETEPGSQNLRRTRNSAKTIISPTPQETTTSIDMNLSPPPDTAKEKDQAICPAQNSSGQSTLGWKPGDSKSLADHLAAMSSEEFELYLNSLDDNTSHPLLGGPNSEDFSKARRELSSLLAMDLLSLITSEKLPEVLTLSSMIQSDPHLMPTELSMLDLIQGLPLAGKKYLDVVKQATPKAGKLEANISDLKSKYDVSEEKLALLRAESASASSAIQEIDEQISSLLSRRAKLAQALKRTQSKIAEHASTQKQVFDSVFKIVSDGQTAPPQRGPKQKKASKMEAEIRAKFAPLEGFSFMR